MTFVVYVKLKLSINERISHFRVLPEKQHIQQKPAYNVALYPVFRNESHFSAEKEVTAPRIATRGTVYTASLPSYEINIMTYHISFCC